MKLQSISVFGQRMRAGLCKAIHPILRHRQLQSVFKRLSLRILTAFLLAGLAGVSLQAQVAGGNPSSTAKSQERKGTITGRAMDTNRDALVGARVELQPKGLTAVSDAQGQFTISDLSPGNYTLIVSYIGFAQFSAPVTVTAGGVAQVDAVLQIEAQSQQVIVRGERERGEVEALNREKTADTIVQVLPAEVITSLPNTNVADALGRLPSVSLERDEGEGKYVQIRGTEPRLSNVTINNVHVSSPERDVRNVKLDVIPADLVESIEVSKTLSANQDGDAIGGSVNLVTRTADDEAYYGLSGIGGYTPITNGRGLTQFGATIGRRFGTSKRLGVVFGGSYDYNGRGFNNIEPAPGTNDFMDGRGPVPVYTGIHLREYEFARHRYGFAGSLDYRLNNGSSAYVRGLFSEFKDFGDTWNVNISTGNLLTQTTSDNTGRVILRHLNRTPEQRIYSITAGEKLNLGHFFLDYQFAVSRESQDGQFPSTYFKSAKDVAFGIDASNPTTPKFPVLNGINIYDPTRFTLQKTIGAVDPVRELDWEGSISLARHYIVGSRFGSFEFGGKIRSGDKTNKTFEPVLVPTGAPAFPYTAALGGPTDSDFYFKQYTLPPLSNYSKIAAFIAANPGALSLDVDSTHARSDPNNYNTTERIFAVYAMNTITFGRARLQTGVRIETTHSNFLGYNVVFGTIPDPMGFLYQSTTPVRGDHTYANVLPSVQFQYAFTPSTNLRAAYGMGIARPNFSDLPPFILESDIDNTVMVGNPALKATRAHNFDLLVEHFLKPVGLVQAGVFYKELRDPIFSVTTTIPLTAMAYPGFDQTQPINGTNAHIFGFEATYQQHLTFFPGPLNGLGVSANYSYTTSSADVPLRADHPALSRQGPNNWNLDVTYDKRRLSARVGLTHNDAYIYQYNFTTVPDGGIHGPNGDVYTYQHTQLDAQGAYRLYGGLKFVVSLLNLTNEVFGFYQGSPQFPTQREFYSRTYMFGFRWSNSKEK